MKLKKIKSVICITTAISLALLSGCANRKSQQTEAVNENGVPKDPYEIQWYFDASSPQKDVALVEDKINEYLKDKINATVKINCLDYGTYKNKIVNMMAAGTYFDISFSNSAFFTANVAKGSYLALNDYFDKYMPKTKEILGDAPLSGVTVDGKIYGVPANKDRAHHYGFVYRKDLVEKYNLNMKNVKSFDDLFPILEKFKTHEPKIISLGVSPTENPSIMLDFDKIDNLGGFYPDKMPGKVVNMFETPEYKEMLLKTRKAFQSGYIDRDAAVAKNFSQLKSDGSIFCYPLYLKPGKIEEMNENGKYEWDSVDITVPRMMRRDIIGSVMTISRTSKNPARVAMFLELLNTDKYLNNLVIFGIEGKDYKRISENVIDPIKDSGYSYAGLQWKFGNTFLNYLTPGENKDKVEILKKYNESAECMPALGFSFDAEPVKIESAACQNVIDEYAVQLELGTADVEDMLPKFIQKLKQAGADRVIAEQQAQYDKWKSKQN